MGLKLKLLQLHKADTRIDKAKDKNINKHAKYIHINMYICQLQSKPSSMNEGGEQLV